MKNLLIAILFLPVSAWAGPITATLGGCIDAKPGTVATWTASTHMRHTALWSQNAGCHATGDDYVEMGYLIDYIINEDGTSSLMFHSDRIRVSCGRIQIDAQLGLDGFVSAIMVNLGTDCDRRDAFTSSLSVSGATMIEPSIVTFDSPAGDPPTDDPPADDPPTPTQFGFPPATVPDRGSIVVVAIAIAVMWSQARKR